MKTEKPFPVIFVGKLGQILQASPNRDLIDRMFHSTTSKSVVWNILWHFF